MNLIYKIVVATIILSGLAVSIVVVVSFSWNFLESWWRRK